MTDNPIARVFMSGLPAGPLHDVPSGVAVTNDFWRIVGLPRRYYRASDVREIVQRMTQLCRAPNGTMTLLDNQAIGLFEFSTAKGLFGGLGTGEGKTLLSFLAPLVTGSYRPLLTLPAALIAKTESDRYAYLQHWRIPVMTRIESYEKLCRSQHVDLIEQWQPDLIVADEAHKLRSTDAAATKRIHRYLGKHPNTRCAFLSGTMTTASIRDYEHLMRWALGAAQSPLPLKFGEMDQWSLALDEREGRQTCDPGALYKLCTPEELAQGRTGARLAFRRRLSESFGVVLSSDSSCNASIVFRTLHPEIPAPLLAQVDDMRDKWETPNGDLFDDALSRDRHTRTMLTGFYGYWDPPAPRAWLMPRREWAIACRDILRSNRRNLDSAKQVRMAIEAGLYPEAVEPLAAWLAVEPTFTPNPQPRWLSDYLVRWVAERLKREEPTLVWCAHVPFAEALQRATGLPYYGRNGLDSRTGRLADNADPTSHAILSVQSNCEGRNLQQFFRNLIVSPSSNNKITEQLLSRTHRRGQQRDELYFDFVLSHEAHFNALARVIRQARYGEQTLLGRQKILMGSWVT